MRTLTLACLALVAASIGAGCLGPDDGATDDAGPGDGAGIVPTLPVDVAHVVHVDPDRWSGEPSILALEDGTLLVTGAGGLTRYVEDPADAPGNAGQSYLWRSTDGGQSWRFVDLGLPGPAAELLPYRNAVPGVEGDLAADEAGNAYFVDLAALASNGLSVSADGGETWTETQNPVVGLPGTDRPWVAALGDGEVYVKYLQTTTGWRAARSTDGGMTFPEDVALPACSQADMTVDLVRDEVLVPCAQGGELSIVRTATGEPMAWERVDVGSAEGPVSGGFPALAVAGAGEYAFAWVEAYEDGMRARLAVSMDAGQTWTEPVTLSAPERTAMFPWVDANAAGVVGVVWYEADAWGDPNELDAAWYVQHASVRLDRVAAAASEPVVTRVTTDKVHQGSICNAGLGCVLDGRSEDRRLLDFFEVDVDVAGASHIAWTSTETDVPTIWYGQVRPTA